MKKDRIAMKQKPDISYTSEVVSKTTKNYRRVSISKEYWIDCGQPDVNLELFKKCVFIGYGAAGIRALLTGMDSRKDDVHLTAEYMGYNTGSFEIVVKE